MQCRKTRKNKLEQCDKKATVGFLSARNFSHYSTFMTLGNILHDCFKTVDLRHVSGDSAPVVDSYIGTAATENERKAANNGCDSSHRSHEPLPGISVLDSLVDEGRERMYRLRRQPGVC